MKYKLVQRVNPQNRDSCKWYAQPINEGCISQNEIINNMIDFSSLSPDEITGVLENFIGTIPYYMLAGKSVNLAGLGTLRLSFTSEGVEDPSKFNPESISGIKIIFTPSVDLKSKLKHHLCKEPENFLYYGMESDAKR